MIVPSFSALFADPARQILCNEAPVFWPMLSHKADDQFVFFSSLLINAKLPMDL
jgi:hypothetical protein